MYYEKWSYVIIVVSSRRYKVAGVSKRLSSIWNVIVNETNSCDFLIFYLDVTSYNNTDQLSHSGDAHPYIQVGGEC
jgi:hypothetical protein